VWDIFHDAMSRPLPSRKQNTGNFLMLEITSRKKSSNALLPSERAAFGEPGLASCGLAEDSSAALADDHSLGVREDGRDGEAAGALHVHEEGPRDRHEGLCCVCRSAKLIIPKNKCRASSPIWEVKIPNFPEKSYLKLVLADFGSRRRVEEINGENLRERVG
jgi:hypothetical protein